MAIVVGTVTDRTSGNPLRVVRVETNTGQQIKTGNEDRFTLPNVPAGTVTIKVFKKGYDAGSKPALRPHGGDRRYHHDRLRHGRLIGDRKVDLR